MTDDKLKDIAINHFLESAAIKQQVAMDCIEPIINAAIMISNCFKSGNKLLLCGNGGSAADCQHFAAEFVNYLSADFKRDGLPAIALTTDTSFITAYSNDCGFEGIFERQVKTIGKADDVLIGISTSGNSANVIKAIRAAQNIGVKTVVLIGSKGILNTMADIAIAIPSENTQFIQESHLAVEHILCALVEQIYFFPNKED